MKISIKVTMVCLIPQIWDFPKTQVVHQIHTLASVARIRWRPQRRHFIASCSFVVDFSVSVWDINRPYVPFASFDRHTDVATGICGFNTDDKMILYVIHGNRNIIIHF